MFLLGLIIGMMIGGTLAIILYACIIVGKESDLRNNNIGGEVMNKKQAVAYSQMALYTIQNTANANDKIRDLNLYNFGEEIKIMFELYPAQSTESKINEILLN